MTDYTPSTMNTEGPIVPRGAAYFDVNAQGTAREFAFLLLPQFTLLAFSAALDPLRIANQLAQRPLYRWSAYSEDGAAVTSSCGMTVSVDMAMDTFPQNAHAFVCAGTVHEFDASHKTMSALRRHAKHGGIVGGVCTGAITLARAGILRGKRATLHWENQPAFREEFPDQEISTAIYEIDGKVLTCGGGVASTDMMLTLVEEDFGPQFALAVADMCVYGGRRAQNAHQRSSLSVLLGSRNSKLVEIGRLMHENIEDPLPLAELCCRVGVSRRQVERLFLKYLNTSPLQYYRGLRLDHARALLRETDMSITEVGLASGFSSDSAFLKGFRSRFGISPSKFRGT
ncbi:MAG: GlxA family transcriptional regulator [Thalassovita sp.]